jgi:hypothetical protein
MFQVTLSRASGKKETNLHLIYASTRNTAHPIETGLNWIDKIQVLLFSSLLERSIEFGLPLSS